MQCLDVEPHITSDLLIARNFVAHYLSQSLDIGGSVRLPKMRDYGIYCKYCVYDRSCVLYHKSVEDGSNQFGGKFDSMTGHLSPSHLEYFRLWDKLIDLEKQAGTHTFAWRLPPQEREKAGRAVCSLRLEKFEELSPSLFEYTFRREGPSVPDPNSVVSDQSSEEQQNRDKAISRLAPGDYVILSTMEGIVHLGRGPLRSVGPDHVVIHLDRSLRLPPGICLRSSLWVIDKDELSSGLVRARQVFSLFFLPISPPFFFFLISFLEFILSLYRRRRCEAPRACC